MHNLNPPTSWPQPVIPAKTNNTCLTSGFKEKFTQTTSVDGDLKKLVESLSGIVKVSRGPEFPNVSEKYFIYTLDTQMNCVASTSEVVLTNTFSVAATVKALM